MPVIFEGSDAKFRFAPGDSHLLAVYRAHPCNLGLPSSLEGETEMSSRSLWTFLTHSSSVFHKQMTEMEPSRERVLVGGSTLFVDYKNVSSFGQLLESIFAVLRLSSNGQ